MAKLLENKVMCRQKRLAFTILEILVALSMLGLILSAVYGSYTAVTTSVVRCKPKSVLEQRARLFLQRITGELRCCYANRANKSSKNLFDRHPGKEVVRHEEPPLFMSRDVSSGQIFLQFVTSSVISRQNHTIGGLAIVCYRLDESGTTLLRSERRYVDRFENDYNDCNWLPVFKNVKTIMFEYFEGKKWQQEWNSNDMRDLPQAVRISLILETEDTGPLSFISTAHIVCRPRPFASQTLSGGAAVTVQKTAALHQDLLYGKKRSESQ